MFLVPAPVSAGADQNAKMREVIDVFSDILDGRGVNPPEQARRPRDLLGRYSR